MTREEQIEQTAYRYAVKRQEDPNFPVYNLETEITDAFIKGAEYADQNPDLYSVTRKAVERALENLWHPAQGDDLPAIDREVIVLLDNGKICFGHRPVESYTGISITNHSEMKEYYPERHGKGGWNIPDVKLWLDVSIPNLEEQQ